MAYEKRLCVLKQMKKGFTADGGALSGVVFAERLNGELTITPRIAGLSALSEGRYALAVRIGNKNYCFEWKGNSAIRIPDAPPLKEGFAALVAFVKGEAEPIAFGCCGVPVSPAELLSVFSEKGRPAVPLSPNQTPIPAPNVPLAPAVPLPESPEEDDPPFRDAAAGYDDEAIAAADYFLPQGAPHDDAGARGGEEEGAVGEGALPHEADGTAFPFRLSRGGLTYYNKVAPKLKEAFSKYPADRTLSAVFPRSEWIKTEKALLGVIYGEGLPRYLCVAMEEIPKEAEEAAVFVPVSCFSEEEGVYVVFQDADTGEYVKVENA